MPLMFFPKMSYEKNHKSEKIHVIKKTPSAKVIQAMSDPDSMHWAQHVDIALHQHHTDNQDCVSTVVCKKTPFGCKYTYTHSGIESFTGKGGGRSRQLYHCVLWVSSRFNLKPFDLRGLRSRRGRHV